MKLLRLKITDPKGFRSLAPGFEFHFRTEWNTQEDQERLDFEPFVCAGRNGSGKSNLLEALASIFFQMEVQRIRRNFLPDAFDDAAEASPNGFELEYQMPAGTLSGQNAPIPVQIIKVPGLSPEIRWSDTVGGKYKLADEFNREYLLPAHVLGYSSGENEILSLPFFKMRFVQFDEYWNSLKRQLAYPGHPDARMAYLDREYSQAILLCNLLFQGDSALEAFRVDVGIKDLKKFRIIIRRSIPIAVGIAHDFGISNAALYEDSETKELRLNLVKLIEADEKIQNEIRHERAPSSARYENFDPAITRLKRCSTCWFVDEDIDSLFLDFWVNAETKKVFRENFGSALGLFQAFQVLLNLNLFAVSDESKADLYRSDSHYVNETVPVLPSDERIMRFKDFYVTKTDVARPLLLKELSDGEHQLLHSLGLCLLFRGTNSLFLLDEPETHFNPDWRAQFISRLRQCLAASDSSEVGAAASQEMLITTHTPFLISDSKPENVLVFKKDQSGKVTIEHPDYNTLGASINKITMKTFEKTETVGGVASSMIQAFRQRFEDGEDPVVLIDEIDQTLGDSVEKILLIKAILGRTEPQG